MPSDPTSPTATKRYYIAYRRPRCPVCGGLRIRSYRSTQAGDGSVTRHAKCGDCGAKLIVVAE